MTALRDSGMSQAGATTTSGAQFGPTVVQRNELSKGATQAIATAVTNMVNTVLAKS